MSNLTHNWKGSDQYRGAQMVYLCTPQEKALLCDVVDLYNKTARAVKYASAYIKYSQSDTINEAVQTLHAILEIEGFLNEYSLGELERNKPTKTRTHTGDKLPKKLHLNIRCSAKEKALILKTVALFNENVNRGKTGREYRKQSPSDMIYVAINAMHRRLKSNPTEN
jgi:hypothetical protein